MKQCKLDVRREQWLSQGSPMISLFFILYVCLFIYYMYVCMCVCVCRDICICEDFLNWIICMIIFVIFGGEGGFVFVLCFIGLVWFGI